MFAEKKTLQSAWSNLVLDNAARFTNFQVNYLSTKATQTHRAVERLMQTYKGLFQRHTFILFKTHVYYIRGHFLATKVL